jgi:hypothetical protein
VDPSALFVSIVVVAAAAVAGRVYLLSGWRSRRVVAKMAATPFADVVDGKRVKLVGRVVLLQEPLFSPMSRSPCAGWCLEALRLEQGKQQWGYDAREFVLQDFVLCDEAGRRAVVRVDRARAAYECDLTLVRDEFEPALTDFLRKNALPLDKPFGGRYRYRFREGVLAAGETVAVVGRVRRELDPDGIGGSYREPAMRLVLEADREPLYVVDGPRQPRDQGPEL